MQATGVGHIPVAKGKNASTENNSAGVPLANGGVEYRAAESTSADTRFKHGLVGNRLKKAKNGQKIIHKKCRKYWTFGTFCDIIGL